MHSHSPPGKKKTNRKVLIIGGIVAAVMFAFCFALVPVYSLLCKKTGINTGLNADLITPATSEAISQAGDPTRDIVVQFTATHHMGMPWDFYPRVKSVHVHPGEKVTVNFYAKNPTERDMVAQAIPSMTPSQAIEHFHKIECFCFRQQALKKGEGRDMGIVFQIDKDLPKEIRVITLAYTLFDTTPTKAKG